MELKLKKPLYLGGVVELAEKTITTGDLHGRELIRKGFAEEVGASSAAPSDNDPPPGGAGKAPTVDELKATATELGIENAAKLKKSELIAAIGAKRTEIAARDEQLKLAAELEIEGAEEMDAEALAAAIAEKQNDGE